MTRLGDQIRIDAASRSFLHNQVRILVGTLVAVGHGKMTVATIHELLTHGDRTKAGMTAPACGLTLASVIY